MITFTKFFVSGLAFGAVAIIFAEAFVRAF